MPVITAIIGFFSSVTKGLLGLRTEQAKVLSSAVDTIRDVNTTEKERALAYITYMAAEAQSQHWLPANIRPLIALLLLALVVAWFFGYTPPNLEKAMPPFIEKAVDALMVFIGFYVPGRSLEKIVSTIMSSKILNEYFKKYI